MFKEEGWRAGDCKYKLDIIELVTESVHAKVNIEGFRGVILTSSGVSHTQVRG